MSSTTTIDTNNSPSSSLKQKFAGKYIIQLFSCFFYGYTILFACTIGKILTAPGQSPCIGVVINSIVEDLNISLTTVTGLYLVATTSSSIALTFMGRIIDRVGVRIMVCIISVMLGVACFVASAAHNIGVLLLAFFLLRFFGQGSLMMVSKTTINYWWVDLRGTMMGIAGALVSLGMTGIFPIILNESISTIGWRSTYIRLGLNSIFFMAPFGFLFYRNQPELYGLLPDGRIDVPLDDDNINNNNDFDDAMNKNENDDKKNSNNVSIAKNITNNNKNNNSEDDADDSNNNNNNMTASTKIEIDVDAKEAFKTGAFWSNALSLGLVAATGTAFWFHLKGIMIDNNVDKTLMQSIYPVLAVSSVVGRLISGRMIDTYGKKGFLVLVYGLFGQTVAMILILSVQFSQYLLILVCFIQALSAAFVMNVASVVFANNFGRKYLGEIQGLADSIGVLGSAIGPFPFGLVRDITGSYNMAFLIGSALPFFMAIWVYITSNARMKKQEESYIELQVVDDAI